MSFLSLSVIAGNLFPGGESGPPDKRALVKSHVVLEGMYNVGWAVVTRTISARICACRVRVVALQSRYILTF